jgi:DNA-binding cell septation regulator SpoVG
MENIDLKNMRIVIKPIKRGKMLANANLEFGNMETDGFSISGFKVLNGKYDDTGFHDNEGTPIWVASPSYQDNLGNFKNIFFASPKTLKELQCSIIKEYLKEIEN